MIKSILAACVLAVTVMLSSFGATASPLSALQSQLTAEDNVVAVRDGCGPGYRYSSRRDACVPDDRDFRPPPPRLRDDYDRPRVFGYTDPRMSKERCQSRCLQQREVCNRVKGGYFNGCGIEGAACIARCD